MKPKLNLNMDTIYRPRFKALLETIYEHTFDFNAMQHTTEYVSPFGGKKK